jgi:bifunctional DNA-binding transcriptional regulator/antitoxin component of YhaV-PrlF toxin-antitoxin module
VKFDKAVCLAQDDLMASISAKVHVSETGRLSIPIEMRRKLGLEKGGLLTLSVDENGLHAETHAQFIRRVRQLAKQDGWSRAGTVDDFIAERREAARRENAEMDGHEA